MTEALKRIGRRAIAGATLATMSGGFTRACDVILRYHSISAPGQGNPYINPHIAIDTDRFEQQLTWVGRHADFVELGGVEQRAPHRRRPRVAVTFDDGFMDNHSLAAPILDRLGIPATFFVVTDCVRSRGVPWFSKLEHAFHSTDSPHWIDPTDGTRYPLSDDHSRNEAKRAANRRCARLHRAAEAFADRIVDALEVAPPALAEPLLMGWDELRGLRRNGHGIGSHTCSHPNLTLVEDPAALETELAESRQAIEAELGSAVREFAYPNPIVQPHWNPRVAETAKRCGYEIGVTSVNGGLGRDSIDPLAQPRLAAPREFDRFVWQFSRCATGRM